MFLATGLVTTASAVPEPTSRTARRIASTAAAALDRSGRPGSAVTVTPMSTTGKARPNAARAAPGSITAIETSGAMRSARRCIKAGSARRENGARSNSARRRQAARVMSGPMPAGSPSVSARGIELPGREFSGLDQSFATQPLQIRLRLLFEALGVQRVAGLTLAGRIGPRVLLAADRDHFHAMPGDFRRGQLADRDPVENLALLGRDFARVANDLVAHDRSHSARDRKAFFAVLEAGAQRFRLFAAVFGHGGRGSRGHQQQDRP